MRWHIDARGKRNPIGYAIAFPNIVLLIISIASCRNHYRRRSPRKARNDLEHNLPQASTAKRVRSAGQAANHNSSLDSLNSRSRACSETSLGDITPTSSSTNERLESRRNRSRTMYGSGQGQPQRAGLFGENTAALQRPRKSLPRGPRRVDGEVEIEHVPAKVTWMDKLDGLVDRKLHQKMYEGSKRGVKGGPTWCWESLVNTSSYGPIT